MGKGNKVNRTSITYHVSFSTAIILSSEIEVVEAAVKESGPITPPYVKKIKAVSLIGAENLC